MKSYTDIEQSKKLAEILPLESADMHYNDWSYDFLDGYEHTGRYKVDLGTPKTICGELDIPCWSLAALLNIMEQTALFKTTQGWVYKTYIGQKVIDLNTYYNEPIDACYEMIIKLIKLGLL